MGNILNGSSARDNNVILSDTNAFSESAAMEDNSGQHQNENNSEEQFHDTIEEDNYEVARNKRKQDELTEFKKQLNVKREQRRNILARHRAEKKHLEESLISERNSKLDLLRRNRLLQDLLLENNVEVPENSQSSTEYEEFLQIINGLRGEMDVLKANNHKLRLELASSNKSLQEANSDITELGAQNSESIRQISALKEVITVSKTMINLRENQLIELKNKLNEIEQSLADREANMLSTDLRQEYERQLNNIRTLRGLYEERARLAEVTKQALVRELDEQKLHLQAEIKKNELLNNKVEELENQVNKLEDTVDDKNNIISSCQKECRGIQSEMSVVNKLFSQVLLGYKSKKDLDRLVTRLEENHGILTHMAEKENGAEGSSALPKLLLDLISQMEDSDISNSDATENKNSTDQNSTNATGEETTSINTAEEIVQNLPKVWRVLMELLSHQSEAETNPLEKVTTCYKSVQTKTGTVLVPSVSQTYIRLKDLILEKLTLIKEVNRMKQLNTHLESRLHDQEKRLCSVTTELSKTWHVVGRLRRHHQQLHTHEKILKYELQQKRKLLTELKEELEYCREKWEQAREKNSQSEKDWKDLRAEFSNRKLKLESCSFNNSAESGYSDEIPSDETSESNDEREFIAEPKIKYKKKIKKPFETNIDSSTDVNLAAEREDPVSDMIDVADLSLDTQDDNLESDSYNSESILKSDKVIETEDECADISHDVTINNISSLIELETNEAHKSNENFKCGKSSERYHLNEASTSKILVDPKTIIINVQKQNERLAEEDKKLISVEKGGADILNSSQSVMKLSEIVNHSLDNIINKPVAPKTLKITCTGDQKNSMLATNSFQETLIIDSTNTSMNENNIENTETLPRNMYAAEISSHDSNIHAPSASHSKDINFQEILENVKRQDKKLLHKEKRLQNLEQACSNIVSDLNNTLQSGDSMISKLDTLHLEHNKDKEINPSVEETTDISEPSTSTDIDHEARFAARDLRLKRLEEQTKSLVKKVNKTATKGVKIHYKLEELHNIYGTDNSRSGTPEDAEDSSLSSEDVTSEKKGSLPPPSPPPLS